MPRQELKAILLTDPAPAGGIAAAVASEMVAAIADADALPPLEPPEGDEGYPEEYPAPAAPAVAAEQPPQDEAEDSASGPAAEHRYNAPSGATRQIALERLHPSPLNPRRQFDAAKLQELAESILAQGLIEPIVVRRTPRQDEGEYEIVAGERRWRAAKLAGWKNAPCLLREDMGDADAARLMAVENLQRVDLSPIEEARAFQAWIAGAAEPAAPGKKGRSRGAAVPDEEGQLYPGEELGPGPDWTTQGRKESPVKELARQIGKSDDYVRERMWLLRLSEAQQAAVDAGKISVKAGLLLARVKDEKLRDECAQWAEEGELTPSRVEFRLRAYIIPLQEAPFDLKASTPSCEGCKFRQFRSANSLLPELERGKSRKAELGFCTNANCFRDKARDFYLSQGCTVRDGYKEQPNTQRFWNNDETWKKNCAGCAQKLVVINKENPAGIRLCLDRGAHHGYRERDGGPSAQDKSAQKKRQEKLRQARADDLGAKGAIAEWLAPCLETSQHSVGPRLDFPVETIIEQARQDTLADIAGALLPEVKEATRGKLQPILRQRLREQPELRAKLVAAYFAALRFPSWGLHDSSSSGAVKFCRDHCLNVRPVVLPGLKTAKTLRESYCGDLIMEGRLRAPYRLNGEMWVCTAIDRLGNGNKINLESYRVIPGVEFRGRAQNYTSKIKSAAERDKARKDPKGFYHGIAAAYAEQIFVLVGPPKVFATDPAAKDSGALAPAPGHARSGDGSPAPRKNAKPAPARPAPKPQAKLKAKKKAGHTQPKSAGK